MSEEVAVALGDLNYWKRRALQARTMLAEDRAKRVEADAAQYRRCLEAVVHFWRRDPLAFGDEASVTTLAGQFAIVAHICEGALELSTAGAPLLAELGASRDLIDLFRAHYEAGGEVPGSFPARLYGYDQVVKARPE